MKERRLLLDGDLLLDVLLERENREDAAKLWARVELGAAKGLVGAHDVAAVHDAARQARGPAFALRLLREVLHVFGVARVDGDVFERALELARQDLEPALLLATAQAARCHAVVTRRKPAVQHRSIAFLSPAEALAALR